MRRYDASIGGSIRRGRYLALDFNFRLQPNRLHHEFQLLKRHHELQTPPEDPRIEPQKLLLIGR